MKNSSLLRLPDFYRDVCGSCSGTDNNFDKTEMALGQALKSLRYKATQYKPDTALKTHRLPDG